MKIKVELLFTLLILTCSNILNFVNIPLIPIVKATYVEGLITQDTVWTLVDSPFVISNEVIIRAGATLTIEPEVEVRFGGKFSITVEGRLIAEGTMEKPIKFTSNELQPEVGSWGAIRFKSAQYSSLAFCIIEYGTNGTIVENGSVDIRNSVIQFNSESGSTVLNGGVNIETNVVANNMKGICIAGGQVIVQKSVISSNEDGIVLTGNLMSEIGIIHNEISFNTHSGILYEAIAYGNVFIRDNTISNNSYGIYVSTDDATQITKNYILNNTVGIFYGKGIEHLAYFNDIYNNNLGMDISAEAYVNATYNYWGSKSGPYHESLNPRGKGNRVGGDGVNLDFIFFLTRPIDYENSNPTAVLWTDKLVVAPNDDITFVGADSYDDGQVNQYLFDFGDGTKSNWTTLSLFFHSYSSTGNYTTSLMVIDDFNAVSTNAFLEINVVDLPPLSVSVTLSNYTVAHSEEVLVTVYVSDGINAVENADVTLFSVKGGSFTPNSGLTDSNGYFVAAFKAPDVDELTDVRIIARASKNSYADGSDYKYLKVLPPLIVSVNADPPVLKSEETATVTISVMNRLGEYVADALLELSSENGFLSAITGVTDLNGAMILNFTASRTFTQIDATITVTVMKANYETQQFQLIIPIEPKILVVEVTADPSIVISEGTSQITARVMSDSSPVSNAIVAISSDIGGNFSEMSKTTDLDGIAVFIFTASQMTVKDGLDATIRVTATKDGYVSGENYALITIKPKILSVQIIAEPDSTFSEGIVDVKVQVLYNEIPVVDAVVTLTVEDGVVYPTSMLSDYDGFATFIFTAPLVDTSRNITVWAAATKDGYVSGEDILNLIVNPGMLDVEITVNPSLSVVSENPVTVTVYVSHEQRPVANATVNIAYSSEIIPSAIDVTDANGICTFVFDAPQTTAQMSIDVVVNAAKYGYEGCEKQTSIIVNPKVEKPAEGWPLTTMFLILVPIIVVLVVLVLVKLKILIVSVGGEEGE